jgi:hypothetical protein
MPLHQRGLGLRWTPVDARDHAGPATLGAVLPVDARDHAGPATLGAVLDAFERSGPRWTGDAWLARLRRYSTALRDRAHNLKEAEGRARTVRFNQRSSNALYCRVNERMNNEKRRDSCSSSLINFVLNLSKLFLMNCRMSSS